METEQLQYAFRIGCKRFQLVVRVFRYRDPPRRLPAGNTACRQRISWEDPRRSKFLRDEGLSVELRQSARGRAGFPPAHTCPLQTSEAAMCRSCNRAGQGTVG